MWRAGKRGRAQGRPAQPGTGGGGGGAVPADDSGRPQRLAGSPKPVRRTRLGGLWVVGVLGAIVLVLLLVFILENNHQVDIYLFGAHFTAPLGVALLLAAVLGVLLVVVPGAGRIIQLRRAARRVHREREELAGRLDEVTGATEPGGGQGAPGATTGRAGAGTDHPAAAPSDGGATMTPPGEPPATDQRPGSSMR